MDEPGLNHIAYQVADAEDALAELEAAGCDIVLPATVIDDITFAYVRIREAYVLEVMSYPDEYGNSAEVEGRWAGTTVTEIGRDVEATTDG